MEGGNGKEAARPEKQRKGSATHPGTKTKQNKTGTRCEKTDGNTYTDIDIWI